MKKLLSVVAIAFGALGASTAHAAFVSQWNYGNADQVSAPARDRVSRGRAGRFDVP
jgi:hypothetical protein